MTQNVTTTKVVKSMFWVGIEKFGYSSVYFISTIVLARILTPEDFGLIGVMAIFISFSNMIVESGLGGALVNKKETSKVDLSTIFVFNLILSSIIYLLLFISSPFIAEYYEKPVFEGLIRVLGLTVLINSFTLTQRVHLIRALQFKKQSIISILSLVIAVIVSIITATSGYGVWALVLQQVVYSFCYFILIFINVRFLPNLTFSIASFKELYGYGSKIFLTSLMQIFYNDGISSLIAKVYSIATTGFYYQGKKLVDFPINILRSLGDNVVFPVLSRVDNEVSFSQLSSNVMRGMTLLSYPFFSILFIFSHQIVVLILGEQWEKSAIILSILSISSLAMIINTISRNILKSTGKGNLILKAEFYNKVIGLIFILIFVNFSLVLLLVSIVITNFIGCIVNMVFVGNSTSYKIRQQLKDVIPALLLTALSGISVFMLDGVLVLPFPMLDLIFKSILLLIIYIALGNVFKIKEFNYANKLILKYIKKK